MRVADKFNTVINMKNCKRVSKCAVHW